MKNLFKILTLYFLVLTIISCKNDNSINELLKSTSNELNQMCPMVVDEYTTLIGSFGGNKEFLYLYKIDKDFLNFLGISKTEWKRLQTINLENFYCTDPDIEVFKNSNVDFVWKYQNLDGSFFDQIEINNHHCNNY